MTRYTIDWMEKRTISVGEIIKATLTGEGVTKNDVTLWKKDWPNWEELAPGREVEGEIKITVKGQYTNLNLYPIQPIKTAGRPKAGFSEAGASRLMDKKVEGIQHAQERKEIGMELAGTLRDAVLIVTSFYGNDPWVTELEGTEKDAFIEKKIIKFRNWLRSIYGDPSDPTERPPFSH